MGVVATVDGAVDIYRVAAHYGLPWGGQDPGRPIQVRCPMHDDSTPSARVYSAERGGYCWTCQRAFGAVVLAATMEGIGITAAAHLLARRYGVDLTPDVDAAEFAALAERWESGADDNTPAARMAAGLAVPASELPWDVVAAVLIPLYDELDSGTVSPTDWVDRARRATGTASSHVG